MNKNRDMSLPTNIIKDEIADKFTEFFTDEVATTRSDLDKKPPSIRNEDSHTTIKIKDNILNQFQPASVDEVKKNYNELTIEIMFTRPITYQLTEAVRGHTFTYNN